MPRAGVGDRDTQIFRAIGEWDVVRQAQGHLLVELIRTSDLPGCWSGRTSRVADHIRQLARMLPLWSTTSPSYRNIFVPGTGGPKDWPDTVLGIPESHPTAQIGSEPAPFASSAR